MVPVLELYGWIEYMLENIHMASQCCQTAMGEVGCGTQGSTGKQLTTKIPLGVTFPWFNNPLLPNKALQKMLSLVTVYVCFFFELAGESSFSTNPQYILQCYFPLFWASCYIPLTLYIFLGQSLPITISLDSLEHRRNILSRDQKKWRIYKRTIIHQRAIFLTKEEHISCAF